MADPYKVAYKKRKAGEPEFVNLAYIRSFVGKLYEEMMKMDVLRGLPVKVNDKGTKMYRWADVLKRLKKYRVYPVDTSHPLYPHPQTHVMNMLGLKPETYKKYAKEGRIKVTEQQVGNISKCVLHKDIDLFLRNWDCARLVEYIEEPVPRRIAAFIMDSSVQYFKKNEKFIGKLRPMPRKKGGMVRYSKAELLRYIRESYESRGQHKRRRKELPEFLEPEVARLYMGKRPGEFKAMRNLGRIKSVEVVNENGKVSRMYNKHDLDKVIEADLMRTYYCEGLPYYTRRAIRCKFDVTDRWIDAHIEGVCRKMSGKNATPTLELNNGRRFGGWYKPDVEEAVKDAKDLLAKKPPKEKNYSPEWKANIERAIEMGKDWQEKKANGTLYAGMAIDAVSQMEAAIISAFNAEDEEKKKRSAEARKRRNKELSRLRRIRNQLNFITGEHDPKMSKEDRLKFMVERPIVTLMYAGKNGGFKAPYLKMMGGRQEVLFRISDTGNVGMTKKKISFAKTFSTGIARYRVYQKEIVPKWIVMVSLTTVIPDMNFHATLDKVPPEVGVVGPFGYEFMLPDNSWSNCPNTYGIYTEYSKLDGLPPEKFVGSKGCNGAHPVEVVSGPFVAIRGEYIAEFLDGFASFTKLGDVRAMMGPLASAIAKKYGIPVMQVPVESWECREYSIKPGTPLFNEVVDSIQRYLK